MSKVATTARWSSAVIGGALVMALQTPPDTAASNAALWIEKITGHLPDLPPWVDALGTVLGIILILTPLAMWLQKRRRKTNAWTDRSVASLNRIMSGDGGPPIEVVSKPNEYSRAWNQIATEEAGQTPRIPFSEVVRRVAYASDWADEFQDYHYDPVRHPDRPWKLLLREICRPLTIGDIETWGIRREGNEEPENGPTPIPANFWTRAFFVPELMLMDPSLGSAGNGDLDLTYADIMFDRAGVSRAWPFAHSDEKPSPFEKIYAEWRARWDEDHRRHAEEINQQPEKVSKAPSRRKRLSDLAPTLGPPQPPIDEIIRALGDDLKEQEEEARLRAAAFLSPRKAAEVRAGKYRNVSLSEALGYAVLGEWGKTYPEALLQGHASAGETLEHFVEAARQGRVRVWGKESPAGLFGLIPAEHWEGRKLNVADIISAAGLSGGAAPFRHLRVNRSEIEKEWPHEG